MMDALTPLSQIMEAGAGVLLVHYPRKGDVGEGQASRGSSALPGFVDTIFELRRFSAQDADLAGFKMAADMNADGVNRYAGKLRDEGRAARTIQAHLNAIKAFSKWLTEHHKLPRDPQADRRRERRILLPEEWRLLETATAAGPERYGMTGGERLLLYCTAIQTGLRSNELRSLTRGQLYFDSDPPYITCKAGSTKNRKDARQYIQPELAASLRPKSQQRHPRPRHSVCSMNRNWPRCYGMI